MGRELPQGHGTESPPRLSLELLGRREARGLSQAEAAQQLGVDTATVARWERGRNRPKGAPLLARLRDFYDLEQADLDRLFVDWAERAHAIPAYRIQGIDYLDDSGLDDDGLLDVLIAMDVADTPQFDTAEVIGDAGVWAEFFRRAPHSWRLLTRGEDIAGYWHFLVLRPDVVARMRAGELDESRLGVDMLDMPITALEPRNYSMWLASLFVSHRHFTPAATDRLVASLVHELETLAKTGFYFSEVVTAAFTPQERAIYRSFGMRTTGDVYRLPNGETGEVYAMSGHDIERRGFCSRRPGLARRFCERFSTERVAA